MRRSRFFRPLFASVAAGATLVAYTGLSVPVQPARAADPQATTLLALLDDVQGLVPSLAGVGALGDAVPTLGLEPGGPDGLDLATLMAQVRANVLDAPDIDAVTSVNEFVEALDGAQDTLADGRAVRFTANETTPGQVVVAMTVTRQVTTGLDVLGTEPIGPGYPAFSLTSDGGVKVDLTLSAGFVMNYVTSGTGPAWLSSPTLSLTVDGGFAQPVNVPGGVGILGIKLGTDSALDLTATLTAAFADPNNDGRLYFDEPGGTTTTDGELSAPGSGAGLVDVGLTDGSVTATLDIEAVQSTLVPLPAVDALVTVTGDLDAGTLDVAFASGAFDTVRGFLNLSTRDLAQGIASAATSVLALQNATGLDLPFMRGDYSSAVGAVQGLVEFLEDNVPEPSSTSQLPGRPSFTSVQHLLQLLHQVNPADDNGQSDIAVSGVQYDAATTKLRFDLGISRQVSAGSKPLNPVLKPLSGANASYTPTTLTDDDGRTFGPELVGRQVVAGTSSGLIASVSGSTLTLDPAPVTTTPGTPPTNYWNGGTPPSDAGYSIAAGDAKIGAVELADSLEANAHGAITNANAKYAQASVTPSFSLRLPIVLDLSDPNTTNCNPDGTPARTCPYSHTDNGITRVIEALPLAADRVMLDVDQFGLTADADITTAVDVDATVGFLGVRLKGELKACTSSASVSEKCVGDRATSDHLLSLGLKPLPGADAEGDIPFSRLIEALTAALQAGSPTDVLDLQVAGKAYANLSVEVPGAPAFFGGTPRASVEVFLPDIKNLESFTVTPGSNIGDLGSFNLDAENPLALFGALLANLEALQGVIGDFPGAGALDTDIPLVGKSFNEVIGAGASGSGQNVSYTAVDGPPTATRLRDTGKTFDASYVGRTVRIGSQESRVVSFSAARPSELLLRPALVPLPAPGAAYTTDSELQGLISTLQDASSPNLQAMLTTLSQKLGAGSAATFEVLPGTPDTLKIKLHWERSYVDQAPMNLQFQFPTGTDRSLIGSQGTGLVTTTASGQIDLALLIPLDASTLANPGAALRVDPRESSVRAGVSVDSSNLALAANLGPFAATLGEGGTGVLKAGLGVNLQGTGSTPQTLTDFVGDVSVAVTGTGSDCAGDGVGSGTPLALCAVFPMKINGVAAGTSADTSNVIVRLPLNTADLADTLNPLGGDVATGKKRVELPNNLEATLADAALNLVSFGDGLTGYLEFTERALRTASLDGKLPLVGKDLQAGADFVGGVRTKIEEVYGGTVPASPDAGAIRDFVRNKLGPALPRVGPEIQVDVRCVTPLQAAGAPSVVKAGSGSGTKYRYRIVALTKVSGVDTPTMTGAPSAEHQHVPVADLDDANSFTLSWDAVNRASGYLVLRSVNGGDYLQIKKTPSTSYVDKGADPPAGTAHQDVPASEAPCPDSTPAEEVTGFSVAVSLGKGNLTAAQGCSGTGCLSATIPLDLGIPGLSLKATDATTGVTAAVGWRLDLKVVFDRTAGFFVDTQEGAPAELRVGAALTLPQELQAQLAFINITATDNDTAAAEFAGLFSIDLKDAADGKLGLDQILSPSITEHVAVTLSANVDVDLHLAANATSALPGIETDFLLAWRWTNAAPSDTTNLQIAFNDVHLNAGDFLGGVIKPIVDMVVSVYKPVQPVIDTLFEPVPVLSDLSQAVGGAPITIASLAETFSTLAEGPKLKPFLDVLKNIRDVAKALENTSGACATACVDVGDFQLFKDKALSTDTNPATARTLINTSTDPSSGYNVEPMLMERLNAESPTPLNNSGAGAEHKAFTFPVLDNPALIFGLIVGQDVSLVEFDSGPLTLGFEFQQSFGPVYAPPPVNIVVGGGASVTLRVAAGFDTYGIRTALEAGKADARVLDSLYFKATDAAGKPLPVVQFSGFLQAGASVSAVVIEVGVVGGIRLTISFFWNDPNNDGKFRFGEFLAAAVNNPICLFNVGGELSLFIKVFITLGVSPVSVSFDFTLVEVVLLEFNLKPDCAPPPPNLAGVHGDTLYLFAGNYGSKAQRAPSFTGDYAFDNDGGTADEKWVVRQHAAKPEVPAGADPDGAGPLQGTPAQAAEPAKITVTALGISEDFADPNGDTIRNVVLDGAGTTGKLQVVFNGGDDTTPFRKNVVVTTGSGKDVIRTGTGGAVIDAGGDDDSITTLERTKLSDDPATSPRAVVSGGAGADTITVGNGRDNTVLGDAPLEFSDDQGSLNLVTAGGQTIAVSGLHSPTGGTLPDNPDRDFPLGAADQIAAGLGGSTIYGNNGDDKIGTASDNPQAGLGKPNPEFYRAAVNTIVGGSGGDRIKSGSASDTIFTGWQVPITQDQDGAGDGAAVTNTVDTGEGSDTVYGSDGRDVVTTHSVVKDGVAQSATVFGGGASDVLIGGAGTDKLYGGRSNDHLVAGPATISQAPAVPDELTPQGGGLAYKVDLQPLPAPVSSKLLVGGGGKDRIYGVDGPATIFGDHEGVDCVRQADPVSQQPTESPVTSPATDADDADLILGGEGVDTVNAGGGDDHVELYGSSDTACASGGADTVFGGHAADLVYGGSGNDALYGDGGADEVFGNTDDDALYGGVEGDRLQGNAGADFVTGGAGADLVIGGTSKPGEPDSGDRLYGDEGADTVIGDNADAEATPSYPADLAENAAEPTTGGADYLYGGDGNDLGYGGLRNDHVFGGAHDDDLEGNNATDHVYGEAGTDNVIGGSSQVSGATADGAAGRPDAGDFLYGDGGDDVIAGDNARIRRTSPYTAITEGRSGVIPRRITLLDLGANPESANSGQDRIFGGLENDVLLGQGDLDAVRGEDGDDYAEGGQADDTVDGGSGQDDLIGGGHVVRSGEGQGRVGQPDGRDTVLGGPGADVLSGDNGQVMRGTQQTSDITKSRGAMLARLVEIYDLGDTPTAGTSGGDWLRGQDAADVLLGQSGPDRLSGGAAEDFAEGGPDTDWVEGGAGDDDLLGGSSTPLGADAGADTRGQLDSSDVVWGQAGDDLVIGDNAIVSRAGTPDELTYRIGSNPLGEITDRRAIQLLDLTNAGSLTSPAPDRSGADHLSGQDGVDVLLGQDGDDRISGGSADDYAEGQGGGDTVLGDDPLTGVPTAPPAPARWLGEPSDAVAADAGVAGQDDLLGGKSQPGFRDGADTVRGNGASDFILGDNGTAVRNVLDDPLLADPAKLVDEVYVLRYPTGVPAGAAKIREADKDFPSTRFCDAALPQCEVTDTFGGDFLYGDGGDDVVYGQDGGDSIWGGEQDDDLYGELGSDVLFGEAGEDAILGDRGGVRNRFEDGGRAFRLSVTQVPKVGYEGFSAGTVTRITDLLHDVNGDDFVGSGAGARMPHNGVDTGGDDRIRGGHGRDSIHAGFGDDLANGDSGGDSVFGDDGADVLWGGKGCDTADASTAAFCPEGNATPRRADGSTVPQVTDYVVGGKGGTSPSSVEKVSGSDILDWRPRGSYQQGSGCTTDQWPLDLAPVGTKSVSSTLDPCAWFAMTSRDNADAGDDQHHQGVDWQYGGWDRDVLQGDEADNGPNEGDRLLDWDGAYNLYTHCNAAYGGFNDVRQHSPAWQQFLQRWVHGLGAGQAVSDASTAATSSFVELALVYPGVDREHGTGKAYPATPGHFDDPNACAA